MSRFLIILCLILGLAAPCTAQSYAEIRAHVVSEEGYRFSPYLLRGQWHVGAGHLISRPGRPLTRYEIEYLLERDIKIAGDVAYRGVKHFSRHPKPVRIMLVGLALNLGPTGFNDFTRFRAAIDTYDYRAAAYELRASQWALQLPTRAARYDAILLSAAH